jgi:hypothetical protein
MPVLGVALLILLRFAVIGVLLVIAMFAETRRNNQQRQAPNSSAAGLPRGMRGKRG